MVEKRNDASGSVAQALGCTMNRQKMDAILARGDAAVAYRTGYEDSWLSEANHLGYTVMKNLTRPNGDVDPGFHKAKDKNGNVRGTYDSKKSRGELL